MKKIYFVLFTFALLAASCQKELGNGGRNSGKSPIPTDFDWATTHDVAVTVGMPLIDGVAPEYAVIRIYASPALTEENLVAKGVVRASSPSFRTAITVPASVSSVYVQATLKDGTVAVREAEITGSQAAVPGFNMKTPLSVRSAAAVERVASSMPTDYPTLTPKSLGDFDPKAVISQTPSSNFQLGATWSPFAAAEYYIPAGAQINGNIDFNGGFQPYTTPVLYVAGKLTLSSVNIGRVTLAVLDGGEVVVSGELSAQNVGKQDQAAIYLFKGGKISASRANLSCKCIVNNGTFAVDGLLDMNNQLKFYNTADAVLEADVLKYSNSGGLYNDGKLTVEELAFNSSADFENCENGVLEVDQTTLESGNTIIQKGVATFGEVTCRGEIYVNCYTYVDEFIAERAKIYLANGVGLEINQAQFNNSHVDLAPGSLFIAQEYNADGVGNSNKFINKEKDPDALMPVIRFEQKAVSKHGATTNFDGPMEVVYDAAAAGQKYQVDEKYFSKSAVLRVDQKVNIPAVRCNGNQGCITPDPEPEPEFIEVSGAPYTYCFEDGWPWIGDYDMNDIVVETRIDRRISKDGSKVEFIRINWETKASGATNSLALAVQLDKVLAGQVASVVSTNNSFGKGPFAKSGLEEGNSYAVIPFFNSVKEVLPGSSYTNTAKNMPYVQPQKHTTTITFTQPVDVATVLESAMNMFIVVNVGSGKTDRGTEIHLAGYKPTKFGEVNGVTSVLPSDPYKYFVSSGKGISDNGMMWALMIPGQFRYPAERNDIRDVYTHFGAWATSGGTQYAEWYNLEAKEDLIY